MNLYHIVAGNGIRSKDAITEKGVVGWQVTRNGFKSGKLKPTLFNNEGVAFDAYNRAKEKFKYVTLFVTKDVNEAMLHSKKLEDYINTLRWEIIEEIY